ncbi:MAG: phage regulatory CII family protein [bacterium]
MSLLDAAYDVVHEYPGGAAAMAARLNKSPTTLCHELTRTGTAKLGLLDAKKISDFTGDLRILQAWAVEAGQMLVPLPSLDAGSDECLARLSGAAKEFSDLVAEVSTSVADGRVSDNELGCIQREAAELFARVHSLLLAVEQRNHAGKPAAERQVR